MEDSHTIVLSLDKGAKNPNSFFAVYDGHGGMFTQRNQSSCSECIDMCLVTHIGSAVAKYAGENVHKRLTVDQAYRNGQYQAALKNSFLGTDSDIKEGEHCDFAI